MTETLTIKAVAEEASAWFESAVREGTDESFVRLKGGAPEWLTELVYDAHGDFGPDDWRYACIRAAVDHIAETGEDDADGAGEFADGYVDAYNGSRFAWLASNLNRMGYVDEAIDEFGWPGDGGISQAVGMGQYMEATEVYYSVAKALQDRLAVSEGEEA